MIDPPPLPASVCRDPDDDELLAMAIAAKVELIVTSDDDLPSLASFRGIPFAGPADATALIAATGSA